MPNTYKCKKASGVNIDEPLLLWSNSNNSLGELNTTLSFDTSKYKYIVISFICYTDTTVTGSYTERLGLIADISKNYNAGADFKYYVSYGAYERAIFITNVTSTGINIRITVSNSNGAVPKHIWALTENTKMPII